MANYDEMFRASQDAFANMNNNAFAASPAPSNDEWNQYLREIGMANPDVQDTLAQGQEQPSFFNSLLRGAAAQGIGTLGGQADFLAGVTGSETLRNLGDTAQNAMQSYSRPHEYTANEIFGSGLSGLWKYLSDPNGAAYDVGGGLGSTAAMAAEAAILSAALPAGATAAGGGALAALAGRLGLKSVATALKEGGAAAKLIKNVIASTPLEAASESGGTYREMTHDEQGNRLEDIDMDKVQEAMAKNFVGNLGVLGASNLLESVGIGRLFGENMRKGILGKVRNIGEFVATNAGQNAWEEGAQTGTNLYAQGKIDNIGQVVNPFQWNEEQRNAAAIGGVAGLGQGGMYGGAGYVGSRLLGRQNQNQAPTEENNVEQQQPVQQYVQPNIANAVTNEQFGDAVNVAMNDKSGNLVDRMRNLQGHITYNAKDGTNCARTVGLALIGTDYQDLINVDNFVATAKEKGQWHTPDAYVPKPGDLAVVNNGNHIVMVSENGGTIQNGQSANGVYESELSPQQMFGSVVGYISTSELSSGGRATVQAQADNTAAQQAEDETKRRLDAVDEIMTGKPAQENVQQETVGEEQPQATQQAELTPEEYINRNMPQIRPINRYQDAFTPEELSAINAKQRKALKNKLYYLNKKNPSRTLSEAHSALRDLYNKYVGNTATTPAQAQPVNQQQNVQEPVEEATVMDSTGTVVPAKKLTKGDVYKNIQKLPANLTLLKKRADAGDVTAQNIVNGLKPEVKAALAEQTKGESQNVPSELQVQGQKGTEVAETLPNAGTETQRISRSGGNENESKKSAQLPQSETRESGNQDVNAQPGQVEQEENKNGEIAEKQGESKVKEAEKKRLVKLANKPASRIVRDYKKRIASLPKTRYDKASLEEEAKRRINAAAKTNQATEEEAKAANEAINKAIENREKNEGLTREERIANAPKGDIVTVMTEDGTKFRVQYKVVEADDVVASNMADGSFAKNPEYPQRLQPRNRQSAVSQTQANKIAAELDPFRLTDSKDANNGAPIIDSEGHVENGNLRMIGIMLAHAKENAPAQAYEQYLAEHAGEFGLNRSDVEALAHPVLVRERIDNADGLIEKIIGSTSGGQRLSAVEQAKQDAKALRQETLDKYHVNEKGKLNPDFVASAIKDIAEVSPNIENEMRDKEGNISQLGEIRLKNALFARAYDDDALLERAAESKEDNVKSLTNALLNVAPIVAQMKSDMEAGDLFKADFTKPMLDAVRATINKRNENKELKEVLQAQSLWEETELSEGARTMLQEMGESNGSTAGITRKFNAFLASVKQQNNNDINIVGSEYDVKTANPDELVKHWIEGTKGVAPLEGFDDASVAQAQQEKERVPLDKKDFEKYIFDNYIKDMKFTQEVADNLLKDADEQLDEQVKQGKITKAKAKEIRDALVDKIKRGFLLNDGRKLLEPKVRKWIDKNPPTYDTKKSLQENEDEARQKVKDFATVAGVRQSDDYPESKERNALQDRIVDYLYNVGIEKRKREKKVTIIIGLSASGKSTISNELLKEGQDGGYLLTDADEAKALLPENNDGLLAGFVHEESSSINKQLLSKAIEAGDNICLPTVGGGESLFEKIQTFKDAGYRVKVSLAHVPVEVAKERIIKRFEKDKRFVDTAVIDKNVLQKPTKNVTINKDGKEQTVEVEFPKEAGTDVIDTDVIRNYMIIKYEDGHKGVDELEWVNNNADFEVPLKSRIKETSSFTADRGRNSGELENSERVPGGTQETSTTGQDQVNRTDTENQGGSSFYNPNGLSRENFLDGILEQGGVEVKPKTDVKNAFGMGDKKQMPGIINKKALNKPGAKEAVKSVFEGKGKKAETANNNAEETKLSKDSVAGLDVSDAKLQELQKKAHKKLYGQLSANPMFDPELWGLGCHIGAIYIARGARKLSNWTNAMIDGIGEKIRPWLGALWQTLNSIGTNTEKLDPELMTKVFNAVGAIQEMQPDITEAEFYKELAERAGSEVAVRPFKPYIKAAFAGMNEYNNPGKVTKYIDNVLKGKGANENERTVESVAENNEQNAEGAELPENTAAADAGRTTAEVVGTGSAAAETVDNGRDQNASEVRETAGERTGNDNQGLGTNASENVRETAETGQSAGDSGSTVSSNGAENESAGGRLVRGQSALSAIPGGESGNRENDTSVPGIRNGRAGNGERIVSEDGSYEILPSGDYHVIDAEKAEFGASAKEAFKRNALALSIIKRMQEGDDSIEFTPEVKNALANFNGFGRFRNQLFNGTYEHMLPEKGWEKEAEQLKELMTKEEWEAAQNSTTTAFYTPYGVANAMWNLAKQLGLKHGNILEPSMGVGGFFATMPTDIMENSTVTGIDIDQNAAKIGEVLYPSAHVFNEGYEDHIVKNNSFDFIVTNVPYENMSMEDTPEAKQFSNPSSVLIHDFFFLRGLNQLRPGGIMMALTSTGTLDKQDTQIRLAMAQQAELVGAVRLPNGMFSKSSGTEVACDLLVFRKREEPISRLKAAEEPWVHTHTVDDGKGKTVFVNNYFAENEGNIIGEMKVTSGRFGPTIKTIFSGTTEEMNAALNKVIEENFPKNIMGKTLTKAESEYTTADTSHANHTFYIKDGELMYRNDEAEIDIAKDKPVESKLQRPAKLSKILDVPAGQSPTGKNISTSQKGYDDFLARHPEFKSLDWRNSKLDKKPDGKTRYSWKDKLEDVASKDPALAQKAIDTAFKEKVALEKQQKTEKLIKQIKPLIELNEKVQELVDAMTKGEEKQVVEKLRKEALDLFNKAVESTPNKKLAWEVTPIKKDGTPGKTRIEYDEALKVIQNFGDGNTFTNLAALDKGDGKPADLLTGIELQSVAKVKEPSVDNSLQTQIVDGAQTIDIDKIAEENGKTAEEVLDQLIKDDAVFETLNGDFVPHNVYLSGNVRQKLREAQVMAQKDKKFQRNVDALKKVIPEDLTSSEISTTIGASWVPVKMYKEFFSNLLKVNPESNVVTVVNDNGKWKVEIDEAYDKRNDLRMELAGDTHMSVSDVLNAAMNKRHLKVYDTTSDHKKVFNQAATDAVEAKIVETNDKFKSWLWDENDERREAMEHKYNEEMNCTVNPQFNAEFVKSYPGMVKESIKDKDGKTVKRPFFPFDHQRNVVLKFLTEMRGIAAHDAGTGKTLIMSMLCMEMRRTGKAKKPIIFAHNANSAEIAKNFKKYYPGAKVLYVKEFSQSANSDTTEILLSQMMTGDWDAIVLPHSLMERVAFTEETALRLRQEEIDYWTQRAIAEANEEGITLLDNDLEADEGHKYNNKTGASVLDDDEKKRLGSVADYVRKIRTIKRKCHLMGQRLNAKGFIDFEKTGIDCCLIDEAHEFKKGPKDTSRTVKGLDTGTSDMGTQMDMLAKFVNDRNGNKGVFEFTGTLITNTIPEIHTHMKYVMPDVLKQAGIYHLDDFLSTFTETSTELEPNAAGEPTAVERLRKFTNIPELRNLAGQHIDIVTVKDLPDFSPRLTKNGKSIDDKTLTSEEVDYLKNGYDESARPKGLPNHEVVNVTIPATKRTDYIYKRVKEIAKWIDKATGVEKKEIFAKGIGLKFQSLVPGIGSSIRNLYKDLKDLNTSKADMCIANIRKEYDDAVAKGHPCAQVIFMEKGYNDERTISEATGEETKGKKWKKLYTDIYNVAGYNMAKDLQDKLVAAGFKPEEIAIAGGDDSIYKDPDERKKLAEKVKTGEVKIVIAQYGTMGVGVNMQDNLRAIHHIDAPWMPGELEQENKRGIRQGNHWNTVREYRYISPGMDSKKWSALATKASFIAAFMDTKSKVRTIESDALGEENSGTASDILSSLTESLGDMRYAQRKAAQDNIERLEKQRTNFETRRRKAKEDVKKYKDNIIPKLKTNIEHVDVDSAVYAHDRDVHPGFSIQIRNAATGEFQTFTDKESAQSFLEGNQHAATSGEYAEVCEKDFIRFRGFKIGIKKEGGEKGGLFSSYYELTARSAKPDFEAEAKEAEEKAKAEAEKAAKEGKKETKKKEPAKPKAEGMDLTKVDNSKFGKGEYKTNTATIGSLQSVLSNLGNAKDRWNKELSKAEELLVGYESQANAEWKDQPKLDAQKKKLKAIEDDLKENTVPAPEWFRTVAAVGNLVRYNDALYPIVGHSIPDGEKVKDYGIIVENPTVGNEERIRIPASEARDENGVLLFQPEDLQRDPRQRIVDEADDVNYDSDFERVVDMAFNNILDKINPENWEITNKGVRRKTTEAETGRQGMRWKEETIGDEKTYTSPELSPGEPVGGEYKSFTQRLNKLEASVAESTEPQIRRSVDEIVDEVKAAFPGARDFHRNGQHLMFIMPNGTSIAVDIANQVFLSGKEAEDARKAHGKNADEPIRVNGYTETFGKDAAIKLAQDGDRGTAFHESYHPAYNLVLTAKEKAAMEKEYGASAKEQGKSVIEVSADAYRDWQLARKERRGTRLGKLFQKIQDFAYKALAVLTRTENAHNVMRKIAENEVWNREPRRNMGGTQTDYLVTNNKITGDTQVPVIDITGVAGTNPFDGKAKANLAKSLLNKSFRIIGSDGIGFTKSRDTNIVDGKSKTDKPNMHIINGQGYTKSLTHPIRQKALTVVSQLLDNAVYIEKRPDMTHNSDVRYVDLYAAVQDGNKIYPIHIQAREKGDSPGLFEVKKALFYNLNKKGALPPGTAQSAAVGLSKAPSEISVAELLQNVKDKAGRPYVVNGQLQYEPAATPALPAGKLEASISSVADKGIKKAEAYANRNQRTANQNTAEGRTAQIFKNTTNKNAAQSAVGWIEEQRKNFYRDFVDKNDAFHKVDDQIEAVTGKKLTEDSKIYNKVQILKALATGAATTLIEGDEHSMKALRDRIGGTVDAKNNPEKAARAKELQKKFNLVTMKDVMQTIEYKKMDAAHPDYLKAHGLNNWREAFGNYLGARRLLELMHIAEENGKEYKLPKNISAADLQATVDNAPKEFAEAAKKYYQLQENMLVLMEDGGLINQEIHEYMNKTYHDYCPLMVDFSDTASFDKVLSKFVGDGNSIVNVNNMLKFVLEEGSERGLISPLESTYKSISMLTSRAERNKVASFFVQAVENDDDLKNSGLLIRVPGKADDPKNCVFTVLMNGEKVAYKTTQDLYGPIVGGDEPTGGMVFSLMKNTARTLRAGATTSPSFIVRNLIRDTIFAGVSSRNGFIPVIDSLRGAWALWNDPKLKGEFEAAGVTAFNYYGSMEHAVSSLDQLAGGKFKIHNLGDFIKALFKYAGAASEFVEASTRMGEFMKARAAGKSLEQAALDAKDVTLDFSRSGRVGQKYNQVIPFFNAAIQGGDKMIRLLADPKTRMHTARMLGMYIMIPSLLLWIYNKDEPWYEEIDPHIKMNNWILPGGIRIPKPQEAGVFFGSGLEALMDEVTKRDPKAMANWIKSAREAFLPNLIPTLFLPLMEWEANYSFFREKAIEGKRLQRLPVEQRYNNSTSELNKAIGRTFGLSPVKLDNTVRGFLGTMGMFAWQLPDYAFEGKQNLPSKQLKERTFIRDFVLNDLNMNRTSEDFYDLVSAAQQKHAGYGKKGKPTPATAAINKALRDVSQKNKEIQQITNAKGISSDRKRQMIDQKRKVIHQIQKATLKKYRSKYDI